MSAGKTILGVIAGASIGAIAGILLAPDKGSATRKKIADHTVDLGNLLSYWAADLIEDVKNGGSETVLEREYAVETESNITTPVI